MPTETRCLRCHHSARSHEDENGILWADGLCRVVWCECLGWEKQGYVIVPTGDRL